MAFRAAGLFWSKKGLNELADVATPDAFKEITRRINGGTNGLAERQAFYAVACKVLGVANIPLSRGRTRGAAPIPADEPTFERGWEAIRVHARQRPGRNSKKGAPKRRAKSGPRKKAASKTRTRKALRSSKKKR